MERVTNVLAGAGPGRAIDKGWLLKVDGAFYCCTYLSAILLIVICK